MNTIDSRGPTIDQEIWNSLLLAGTGALTHELWCAAIRAVAEAVLSGRGVDRIYMRDHDEYKRERERLIAEWQDESPGVGVDDLLFLCTDCPDVKRVLIDNGMSWDEKINLCGHACVCVSDLVGQITHHMNDWCPAVVESVTEEAVEDFYARWRTRFLSRVLVEAKALMEGKWRGP